MLSIPNIQNNESANQQVSELNGAIKVHLGDIASRDGIINDLKAQLAVFKDSESRMQVWLFGLF